MSYFGFLMNEWEKYQAEIDRAEAEALEEEEQEEAETDEVKA